MTYKEFKKGSHKTEVGRFIFEMWIRGFMPLIPAMKLFKKISLKINKKTYDKNKGKNG